MCASHRNQLYKKEIIPESVKLIIDCSEKPRDNALFYAFQVFKLFPHKVQLLLPIPPSPFPKGRGRLQGTAAGVLRTPVTFYLNLKRNAGAFRSPPHPFGIKKDKNI